METINGTNVLWIDTYCRNPERASADTAPNWVTIATDEMGRIWERSNIEGAGQSWDYFGRFDADGFSFRDANGLNARIVTTIQMRLNGETQSNAGSFGGAYSKATMLRSTVNKATGRRLTAAPSILNGAPTRDKNVNQMRAKVATIDMAAAMAARRK